MALTPEFNFYPLGVAIPASISPSIENLSPNTPPLSSDPSNITVGPNGTVMSNGVMQSPNYAVGVSGWIIKSNGDVEFNDGTFRGALSANTIDIGGSDSSSFHVDVDGNMWLGAATFAAAPFSVTNAGVLISTSATVNESVLAGNVFYGSGSDGTVTISADTTLSRNMYYNNLTVNSGIVLTTAGYQIFVKGTLTNAGTIRRNGTAGAAGSNGTAAGGAGGGATAAQAAGTLAGAAAGGAGGAGSAIDTAGSNGSAGGNVTDSAGVNGSEGGAGGRGNAAGNATPGSAGTVTAAVSGTQNIAEAVILRNSQSGSFNQITSSAGSSGGGGGGGQAGGGGHGGGGGGAGGGPGGMVAIYAKTITNSGTISANGGAGGNGGNGETGGAWNTGGGGGGGGGPGGVLILVYRKLTDTGTISVTGGAAGSGGALGGSAGSGTNGAAGTAGSTGTLIQLQE